MCNAVFLLIVILLHLGYGESAGQEWPAIPTEARPWTRWWWHGSAVTEPDLSHALETYRAAGLGGVEITPIYGVAGHEARFIDYLSSEWMDRLAHTLREAERLELGVDMATGTGWPFGGPSVAVEHASRYVARQTYQVRGGERLNQRLVAQQEPLVRAVGNQIYETHGIYRVPGQLSQGSRERPAERAGGRRIEIADLVQPVASNPDLQTLALDQVRFPRPLPLEVVVAYSDGGDVLDLTNRVNADGELNWVAPAGDWQVLAMFQGWHGKMVERAAPGGEGSVIDHFSSDAIRHYLVRFDSAFAGRDARLPRAFFNDSYEVDDAAGEADWTPALFEEFERLRGYDLRRHLPALFGDDSEEKNARVLSDYRETISDLILQRFTREWRAWARGKGALVRNQAHGSPANILDLYAASDIPETEGTEILRFKFATSAANVTGKRLASAEAATWLGEHFTSSLADVRRALDGYLLGGVNHIVYHGTAYSPRNEPWPGWLFYAAVHFTPANPWWTDFGALNRYVARVQSFLQAGKPDNDVLLYFPVFDRYAERSNGLLEHFDGIPASDSSAFRTDAERMLERGHAFDYISDRQLQEVAFADGVLQTGGTQYRTVVVPEARYIPLPTLEKLLELVRSGANVIVHGDLPFSVPGLGDLENRTARFAELMDSLSFEASNDPAVRVARLGDGAILTGDDLGSLLEHAGVRREDMVDSGLRFVRRRDDGGTTYFVVNSGASPFDGWVTLAVEAAVAAVYDPMAETSGLAGHRPAANGRTEVYLQIAPGESRVVRLLVEPSGGRSWSYHRQAGQAREIQGTWTVEYVVGGPELPATVQARALRSWTENGGDAARSFSGTARYTTSFARPPSGERWILNLGRVHESARVRLNGRELGTLIGPNYTVMLEANQLRDENRLEVFVTNLMANRIADLDRRSVFWKKFYNVNFPARLPANRGENGLFDASQWTPLPSGLVGPVTLTPVETFQP